MFSLPALLIVAGLAILALVCSLFPVAPTARAALFFLIAAVGCFFVPPYIGLMIAMAVVGLVLLDAILGSQKVKIHRTMPTQMARGVPSNFRIATWHVSNTGKRNALIPTRIRQPRCADIYLSRKEASDDLQGKIIAHRRGLHTIPPFATRTTGPLGLAIWHRPFTETHQIKVFPDLPAAYRLAQSIQQGRFATAGLKRKGPLGLGTNFESVREYFPEDDIRNVNWSATARIGRPMTNQYRVEQDRDVIVLLDSGRLMTAPAPLKIDNEELNEYRQREDEIPMTTQSVTRLDIALDSLCGLVSVADVMGDRAGVIAFNSSVHRHLKPRRAGARAVIRTVFDLEPIPVDSDFEAACQRIGKSKRSFVLILTDLMDRQSCEPLIRALRTIVKKHRVVVGSIIDPDVENVIASQESSNGEIFLKAGASEMQRAALECVEAIKNAGAEVVYCNHEQYMLECVKTYLGAKQRAAF